MSGQFTSTIETDQIMLRIQDFKIINPDESEIQNEPALKLIAGDASDRKFFRLLNNNLNAICMQFPKWEGGYGGDPISWIGMHNALAHFEIPVPKLIDIDETESCIWTEDLGDIFLSSILKEAVLDMHNPKCKEAISYYKEALDLLILAQYPNTNIEHPALHRFFDFEKLFYELNFFITHFLNDFLKLNIKANDNNYSGLFEDFILLTKKLDGAEKVLCHRDYHSRNLMIKNDKVIWIDFQDARMGPHSYDVVSLLRDSYVKISWDTRKYLYKFYLSKLNSTREKMGLKTIDNSSFELELLFMGLQRNIKAIGSFGYLATKKNKPQYLQYVKHTLSIICSREAQTHDETDLKILLPNLFSLLDKLYEDIITNKLPSLQNYDF